MFSFGRVTHDTPRSARAFRWLKSTYALSRTTTSPALMSAHSPQALFGSESRALLTMTKLGGKERMFRAVCILAAAFCRLCLAHPMLKAVSCMVVESTARMVRLLNRHGSPGQFRLEVGNSGCRLDRDSYTDQSSSSAMSALRVLLACDRPLRPGGVQPRICSRVQAWPDRLSQMSFRLSAWAGGHRPST